MLQRRRAMLQSQLDAYRSLRQAQQELAVSEQQLRAVEKALVDAPPERRRSAEQEAAIAALDEQRDLRLRRRDAQREELESLQEGVSTATRTPLPDDDEATAKVSQDVREMVRNGGTTPAKPADPSPPRPDVVAGREEDDGKPREEVGTSGPPDPRGPRDESEERRAGREQPGRPPSPLPVRRRVPKIGRALVERPTPTRSAPAPAPDEPSVEEERAADTSRTHWLSCGNVRRRWRGRPGRRRRRGRPCLAERLPGRATAAPRGRQAPRSSEQARPGEADRAAVKPSPTPRPRPSPRKRDASDQTTIATTTTQELGTTPRRPRGRPRTTGPALEDPDPRTRIRAAAVAQEARHVGPAAIGQGPAGEGPRRQGRGGRRRTAKHADDEDSDEQGLGRQGLGRQGPGRQGPGRDEDEDRDDEDSTDSDDKRDSVEKRSD